MNIAAIGLLIFWSATLLVPLAAVLWQLAKGFAGAAPVSFLEQLEWLWPLLLFTLKQATLSVLCAGTMGVLAVALSLRWSKRMLRLVDGVCAISFAIPTALYGLAYIQFWSAVKFLHFGLIPILVGHTFFNFAFFYRELRLAVDERDRTLEWVGRSLGATPRQVFCHITLPALREPLVASALLGFLYCASSFLLVLLLGGGPQYSTLEVALYRAIRTDFQPLRAALLCLAQLGIFCLGIFPYLWFKARRNARRVARQVFPEPYSLQDEWQLLLGFIWWLLFLAICLLPLLTLLLGGLWGLPEVDWPMAIRAVARSLVLAILVGGASTGLAIVVSRLATFSSNERQSKYWRSLPLLALAISPFAVGLGVWLSYVQWVGMNISAWCYVFALQVLFALPLSYRPIQQAWDELPIALLRAAASCGAGSWERLVRIEWPLCWRSIRVGLSYGTIFSLCELALQLIFTASESETLISRIFGKMGQYGFPEAAGLSAVLLVIISVVGWWGNRRTA